MDIRGIEVIDLNTRRLDYLERQQALTARNIANSDTPGFRALKMKSFSDVMASSMKANAPQKTHPMHLSGTTKTSQMGVEYDRNAPMSPDGNSVVLEEQMGIAAENSANHSFASSVYKKTISLINTSIK